MLLSLYTVLHFYSAYDSGRATSLLGLFATGVLLLSCFFNVATLVAFALLFCFYVVSAARLSSAAAALPSKTSVADGIISTLGVGLDSVGLTAPLAQNVVILRTFPPPPPPPPRELRLADAADGVRGTELY